MAFVITQPCIGTKDATCVEVCPVDCIHSDDGSEMNHIDPEDQVPTQSASFTRINADYFKR